tara:strand:- start:85738 stop:86310 length:573 start_codon:yes stop_codon:yes gene_type:complete
MKLTLTRHGETEENRLGIMQGHLPGHLSELGKLQAINLAKRLQNEKFDLIYSSDLPRAADTAMAIKEYHPNTQLVFTEKIRERNLGEFQGKTRSQVGLDPTLPRSSYPILDGESWNDLNLRAYRFSEFLKSEHSDQSILLVTHGGFGEAFVQNLTKNYELPRLKNTSITEFSTKNGKLEMLTYNCIKHLP